VVRAGRVAGRGADAGVFFGVQVFQRQAGVVGVAPEFAANARVQVFGEGFSQTVGERFDHDGVVIVMRGFKAGDMRVEIQTAGDGEHADVITRPLPRPLSQSARGDKVGQRPVHLACGFLVLLAQGMPGHQRIARFRRVDFDVVAHAGGREQPVHAASAHPVFRNHLFEHRLRVSE